MSSIVTAISLTSTFLLFNQIEAAYHNIDYGNYNNVPKSFRNLLAADETNLNNINDIEHDSDSDSDGGNPCIQFQNHFDLTFDHRYNCDLMGYRRYECLTSRPVNLDPESENQLQSYCCDSSLHSFTVQRTSEYESKNANIQPCYTPFQLTKIVQDWATPPQYIRQQFYTFNEFYDADNVLTYQMLRNCAYLEDDSINTESMHTVYQLTQVANEQGDLPVPKQPNQVLTSMVEELDPDDFGHGYQHHHAAPSMSYTRKHEWKTLNQDDLKNVKFVKHGQHVVLVEKASSGTPFSAPPPRYIACTK